MVDLIGSPEANDGFGPQPLAFHDFRQHLLRIIKQSPGSFPAYIVLKNPWIGALHFPCSKERCPINSGHQFLKVIFFKCLRAQKAWTRRHIARPVDRIFICPRSGNRNPWPNLLFFGMGNSHLFVFISNIALIGRAPVFRHQTTRNTHCPAGIGHVNGLALVIVRVNFNSRMHLACRRPPNHQG